MSEVFSWGILGTGGIARAFAEDLKHLHGHLVAAVGSRSQESADAFVSLFPEARAFASYEELVQSDLDAIYIATPHTFHIEHALLALNAGKAVLCEKPFTINRQEAAQLIDRSKELSLPLVEAIWTRFLPHIKKIQALVASGVLGEITSITADHGQYLPIDKHPRLWLPELGGGALLDLGIYPLTLAHIILGAPEKISAQATLTELGVDLQTSAILTYSSGAHATINCTMASRTSNTATIAGTLARIEIDSFFFAPTSFRVVTRDGKVTEYPKNYEGIGLREEALEVARICKTGEIESPLASHAMTLELMKIMDQIRAQVLVKYPSED